MHNRIHQKSEEQILKPGVKNSGRIFLFPQVQIYLGLATDDRVASSISMLFSLRNSSMFMTEKSGSSSSLKFTGKLLKYNECFKQLLQKYYFSKRDFQWIRVKKFSTILDPILFFNASPLRMHVISNIPYNM